ncbi:type II toxin-antitoxin system RelE/ParE family toxin [Limnohabitans sp. G3-2]|uniref:type II toxin-antitoxin system RelE/ParE family toxin n=1 Tax=Limnohabitans sp. G3-2 TaxID=1100711 RepID=UPI000C1F79D4|nr:type II toxin-antitoxin system RelE/ParE family toxin [Limnohabitans sp. G3-2]
MLQVSASPSFNRVAKKLHARDKKTLDEAIKAILQNPQLGEEKKGDLAGVFVYKFKLNGQETLLAYELQPHKTAPFEAILLAACKASAPPIGGASGGRVA